MGAIFFSNKHVTLSLLSLQGGMQFFVRATADDNVVDYMYTDISLSPGEIISNHTLHGEYFGENVTFVVSFNLNCTFNFYGENCSIYCKPANSSKDGRYTCDSEGNKICYEGYKNENCQECIPADGCCKSTYIMCMNYCAVFMYSVYSLGIL